MLTRELNVDCSLHFGIGDEYLNVQYIGHGVSGEDAVAHLHVRGTRASGEKALPQQRSDETPATVIADRSIDQDDGSVQIDRVWQLRKSPHGNRDALIEPLGTPGIDLGEIRMSMRDILSYGRAQFDIKVTPGIPMTQHANFTNFRSDLMNGRPMEKPSWALKLEEWMHRHMLDDIFLSGMECDLRRNTTMHFGGGSEHLMLQLADVERDKDGSMITLSIHGIRASLAECASRQRFLHTAERTKDDTMPTPHGFDIHRVYSLRKPNGKRGEFVRESLGTPGSDIGEIRVYVNKIFHRGNLKINIQASPHVPISTDPTYVKVLHDIQEGRTAGGFLLPRLKAWITAHP